MIEHSDFGYIDRRTDTRFCMNEYGDLVEIPFCAPAWSCQDFEVI
jgi:hypothetical protein